MEKEKKKNVSNKHPRHNFSQAIKEIAAKRVAYRCSFPGCELPTIGPKYGDPKGHTNIGVACHICAASPDGPRYDVSMTKEQRKSIDNCIWMCENHSVIIDKDEKKYPVELLKRWKKEAEERAAKNLEDYRYSQNQLKDKVSLCTLFDQLIQEGNYDILRMLIDNTKKSNANDEVLLRYEIFYNIYCNRDALALSINYYLDKVDERQCDLILENLIANNIATGINLVLPFCKNDEDIKLAEAIIKGDINHYLFGTKEDLESKKEDIPKFFNTVLVQKILTNIIVFQGFSALPTMMNGKTFELYKKEFAYEMLSLSWQLFLDVINQKYFKNEGVVCEAYAVLKRSIPKIVKLTKEIQTIIWVTMFEYVKNNHDEFVSIYAMCPVFIRNEPKCKRIWLLFQMQHKEIDCGELMKSEEIKRDVDTLIIVLSNLAKEEQYSFLEDNKYLLKRRIEFLYFWAFSSSLENKEIGRILLDYKILYQNDFLWNCMIAYFNDLENPSENMNWLKQNKYSINYPTALLYIKVLKKYSQWDELKSLKNDFDVPYLRYQIGIALMENKDVDNLRFCIEIFSELERKNYYEKWFFWNFSRLYYDIKDITKAKEYLEKEYDRITDERILLELLQMRCRYSDFKADKYFNKALESNDSDVLFFASVVFEKKQDFGARKKYLVRSLLLNPHNRNTINRLASDYLFYGKDKEDLGSIYTISNGNTTLKIALIDNNIAEFITPVDFLDCIVTNKNDSKFISWGFCKINDIVDYKKCEYKIINIESFSELLSQYTIKELINSNDVTIIKSQSPEEAVKEITSLLCQQETATNELFEIFNESRGLLPISLLASKLKSSYDKVWAHIIMDNKLKIYNNSSNVLPSNVGFILTEDAISTFNILGAFDEFDDTPFLLQEQVKSLLIAELSNLLSDIQAPNSVGELVSINQQVYRNEHNLEYKKAKSIGIGKIKGFIEKIKAKPSNVFKSSSSSFGSFFVNDNLIKENYVLGLAQDSKGIVVTDEPFVCLICDIEKIPHMSAIELLLNTLQSFKDLLGYLKKITKTNFLNYFNVSLYKKMIDLLSKEDEKNKRDYWEEFKKWLYPETPSEEHKHLILNVCRELAKEDINSIYFDCLREIGIRYFSDLYPQEFKKISDDIQNSTFKITPVLQEDGEMEIRIEIVPTNDSKKN